MHIARKVMLFQCQDLWPVIVHVAHCQGCGTGKFSDVTRSTFNQNISYGGSLRSLCYFQPRSIAVVVYLSSIVPHIVCYITTLRYIRLLLEKHAKVVTEEYLNAVLPLEVST